MSVLPTVEISGQSVQLSSRLGGLIAISSYLKIEKNLNSSYDLLKINSGVYSFYKEAGLPLNLPDDVSRGIILSLKVFNHYALVVFGYDIGVFYRTGIYSNGVENWRKWNKLSVDNS